MSAGSPYRCTGRMARVRGVIETVPTFRSLLIHLDPDATSVEKVQDAVVPLLEGLEAQDLASRQWSIPVCYEAEFAPDLVAVAERCGLTPSPRRSSLLRGAAIWTAGFLVSNRTFRAGATLWTSAGSRRPLLSTTTMLNQYTPSAGALNVKKASYSGCPTAWCCHVCPWSGETYSKSSLISFFLSRL